MNDLELLADYISDVKKYPLLTNDETIEFAKLSKNGCKISYNKLIVSNLRFVIDIARDYSGLGLSFTDLINEGNIGLMVGLKKFDPERGMKITTYVVYWIRQRIMRALCERGGNDIRLPGNRHHELLKIKKAMETCGTDVVRVAEHTGLTTETVESVLMASNYVSLDDAFNVETKSFGIDLDDKMLLQKMLNNLEDMEKKVVLALYIEELTPSEVSNLLKIDIKKVKTMRHNAIKKLKKAAMRMV